MLPAAHCILIPLRVLLTTGSTRCQIICSTVCIFPSHSLPSFLFSWLLYSASFRALDCNQANAIQLPPQPVLLAESVKKSIKQVFPPSYSLSVKYWAMAFSLHGRPKGITLLAKVALCRMTQHNNIGLYFLSHLICLSSDISYYFQHSFM